MEKMQAASAKAHLHANVHQRVARHTCNVSGGHRLPNPRRKIPEVGVEAPQHPGQDEGPPLLDDQIQKQRVCEGVHWYLIGWAANQVRIEKRQKDSKHDESKHKKRQRRFQTLPESVVTTAQPITWGEVEHQTRSKEPSEAPAIRSRLDISCS
jgi:hypothetical protein